MLNNWTNYVRCETRSKKIHIKDKAVGSLIKTWKIDDEEITIGIAIC